MNSFLELEQLRVEKAGGLAPATVEVDPRHVTSEIPVNDSVHIHHRKYLEDEVFEQVLRFRGVLEESPDDPLADVGGPHLPGVLPGHYYDHLLFLVGLR